MNLGITRESIGDIIVKDNDAYVYVLNSIENEIIYNLNKVRASSISIKKLNLLDENAKIHFIEKEIYVASNRLDNVIKETFNLSRDEAQQLILKEFVFINGVTKTNTSYSLKMNDRVSVKSKGKFIYLDETRTNKKGKLYTKIKLYS